MRQLSSAAQVPESQYSASNLIALGFVPARIA
jgi:hypothetical protein